MCQSLLSIGSSSAGDGFSFFYFFPTFIDSDLMVNTVIASGLSFYISLATLGPLPLISGVNT